MNPRRRRHNRQARKLRNIHEGTASPSQLDEYIRSGGGLTWDVWVDGDDGCRCKARGRMVHQ